MLDVELVKSEEGPEENWILDSIPEGLAILLLMGIICCYTLCVMITCLRQCCHWAKDKIRLEDKKQEEEQQEEKQVDQKAPETNEVTNSKVPLIYVKD